MHTKTTKFLVSLIILTIAWLPNISSLYAINANQSAVNYIQNTAQNPWTTMALAAAGETITSTAHLENAPSSQAIQLTAPILALVAANQDPRNVANRDYVAELISFATQGQIGDPALINDDAFGILALSAAGEDISSSIIQDSKQTIINAQQANGSWGDTNMTAAAIMALLETGVPKTDSAIQAAVAFLKEAQNQDGGWPFYYPQNPFTGKPDESDSSSDAWLISTIYKLGENPSNWTVNGLSAIDHLLTLQQTSGYFAHSDTFKDETSFSSISTAYAVIALAGQSYPVKTAAPVNSGVSVHLHVEGLKATICDINISATTALEIIELAAPVCGYTYTVEAASFGQYLTAINSDAAAGLTGWLYLVNNELASVGANDYILENNDSVLWYYGDFGWLPTRLIEVDQTDDSITVQAEAYENAVWSALPEATVFVDGQESATKTNGTGEAQISLAAGFYSIWIERTGFVRSNSLNIKIGNPPENTVALKVNVNKPSSGGGSGGGSVSGSSSSSNTLSFTVAPSEVNFGNLAPGETNSSLIQINNTGNVSIHVEAVVAGDLLFVENTKIENQPWTEFQTELGSGDNKEISAALTVPSSYDKTGTKSGSLIIWAQEL